MTPWVLWVAGCVQEARAQAVAQVQGAAQQNGFLAGLQHRYPQRTANQRKVLNKHYDSGPAGVAGGMSTEKYTAIALVSRATAYRELRARTALGVLGKTGQQRGTRYGLTAVG